MLDATLVLEQRFASPQGITHACTHHTPYPAVCSHPGVPVAPAPLVRPGPGAPLSLPGACTGPGILQDGWALEGSGNYFL